MVPTDEVSIIVDLNQFKLYVSARHKLEVSLYFDSPSRRFYLAVLALVVMEMKKSGKITSIPLEKHHRTLAILNETIGGHAGSSKKEKILRRIYRKWKVALPDLEFAPLFKVVGKKKEYSDTGGMTYKFTDQEKDYWANLFEYKGSDKNVRLKFSIDKLGLDLGDARIAFGEESDLSDVAKWNTFVETLQENRDEDSGNRSSQLEKPKPKKQITIETNSKTWKWIGLVGVVILFTGIALAAFWKFYLRSDPSIEPTESNKIASSLPDKPSIAVLPFKNIGGGPEKDHIADGITDTLINNLFRVPQLFVIARNSVYRYKDKAEDIRKVSEQLGVRHIMEGSVQLSGPRLRVNVQLIDAVTGKHLWAEGYDGEMKDLFAMKDNIIKNIITALRVTLTSGEMTRLLSESTDNIDAYLKLINGYHLFTRFTKEGNSQAQELAVEIIDLDPNYPEGYTLLGWTYWRDTAFKKDNDFFRQRIKQAEDLAKKALELNNFLAEPHMLLSYIYRSKDKWGQALSEAEKAMSIAPYPEYMYRYADVLTQVGRPEEAVEICKKAVKTDPIPPAYSIRILCVAYFMSEQYETARDEGLRWFNHIENVDPGHTISHAHVLMAATYAMLGQIEKARTHIAEVRRIAPYISIRHYEKMWNTKYEGVARWISALREAGLE